MDIVKTLEFFSSFLAIFGCFVLMFPRMWAFYVLAISNILAAVVYFDKSQFFFLTQAFVLTTINAISVYRWKRRKIG